MEKVAKISISLLILLRIIFLNYASKVKNIYLTKDSEHYIELSKSISNSFFNDNLYNYWLSSFRMPGYPLILNLFQKIFDINFVIFVNFVADLLSLWLVYKILQKYFSKKFSYFGCILFLTNPNLLISSSQIMTESVSTALFFAAFYFFDKKKYTLSGLTIGLLGIIKPLGLYLLCLYLIILFLKKDKTIVNYLKISIFPLIFIGSIFINNFIQYESTFYSTSSYFHLQWLNEASKSLCEYGDFNNLNVSEPGYVFENWLKENELNINSKSHILINKLKQDSSGKIFENLHCKVYSMARSSVWNMFGVRSANWANVGLNYVLLDFILIFSFIYVALINLSLILTAYRAFNNKTIDITLIIIVFYIVIISTLPFGNSRTRVLIEPLLIISFIDIAKYVLDKKSDKSYF